MAMVRVEVTGPCEVAGVRKGSTVELDDTKVNVQALVKAGHVKVLPDKPAKTGEAS